MRRFLDWTAAQTAGQSAPPNRRNSQQNLGSQQYHQHLTTTTTNTAIQQSSQPTLQSSNTDKDLEIQHLMKLLHEIKYYQASSSPLPTAATSHNQREFVDKIHKTLPLFLNVFGGSILSLINNAELSTSSPNSLLFSENLTSLEHIEQHSRNQSSPSTKSNSPIPPVQVPQMEKFPDLLPFAFTIARLFVSEVRQRASNKHAEDASLAILQFLNIRTSSSQKLNPEDQVLVEGSSQIVKSPSSLSALQLEYSTQGWNLLLSLNVLASSQSTQIIQLLCDASLPSTLVKCLYLFFDLPATKVSTSEIVDEEVISSTSHSVDITTMPSTSTQTFTNPLLVKTFTQLLIQLSSHQIAIDELIKKDDLRLLIGIASSQCLPHNRQWRKAAFQTLTAISRNMRENFLYLEENLSIQNYVENMNRVNSLGLASTDEYIDMIKTLIDFLYNLDVNNRNQLSSVSPLIEQFKASRIIDLIEDLIIKIDETIQLENQKANLTLVDNEGSTHTNQHMSVSSEFGVCIEEYRRYGKRLIQSLATMAKINVTREAMVNSVNLKPLAMSRFEMLEQFKIPRPTAKNCILNYEALRLLKMAWSKCADSFITEAILDTSISLFNDDKFNYFIFESQQLLVYFMTSSNFQQFSLKVKQKLFKFLEFIIIETNYIPCLELGTLGTIIKKKACSDLDLILGLKTLIACLKFNSKFSDIFREIGLLEVIVELLLSVMQHDNLSQNATKLEVLNLLLEASQCLLAGPNNLNCTQFNESGAARYVFNCISNPEFFHLFIPAHSSSSDDGGIVGTTSRTGTPVSASRLHSYAAHHHGHWPEITQHKPSIKQLQKVSFTIIRQLILSSAGDEHLANLLGLLARTIDDLKIFESSEKSNNESRVDDPDQRNLNNSTNLLYLISQEINLKIYILKSLMIILKDSHRCRILFRKAGGFTYIVSSLITLEKSLPSSESAYDKSDLEATGRWKKINSRRIWRLIKNSLMTMVIAIRFEPANLRAFSESVIIKLTEALRRLGCFRLDKKKFTQEKLPALSDDSQHIKKLDSYKKIFIAHPNCDFSTIANDNIEASEACCQLFRYLYEMSLDLGDGTAELETYIAQYGQLQRAFHQYYTSDAKSSSFDQGSPTSNNPKESVIFKRRSQLNMAPKRPPSLDLNYTKAETAILTYPCVILAILDLIPSCPNENLMVFICLIVKSLFKHERNQQLLCEVGVISKLLSIDWRPAMEDKDHFLHDSVQFMLENLTRQSVLVRELKNFLRIGEPLRCRNLDEIEMNESSEETKQKFCASGQANEELISPSTHVKSNEKILTERIRSFVSMMSDNVTRPQPPFIEFDMNSEGLTSIFMPSIAPVNAKSFPPNSSSFLNSTLDVHTNEKNGILGGVGSSERVFPPATGLTFSTWICIKKFPPRSSDTTHNLRLLTIYRGSASTGKEYSCFRIQISALDRALMISTQETLLFDNESRLDSHHDPDYNVRVWNPEFLVEGKWHHIAVTMNRSLIKQSSIHIYVDGDLVHQQRICYISSYVGSINTGLLGNSGAQNTTCSAAAYVNAFIGPLPQLRLRMNACWKQGPCHLVEDALNGNFIGVIYALSPSFIGNFQSSQMLLERAKIRNSQQLPHITKFRQSKSDHTHKPLVHQQSAQVAHHHSSQLTRVSSSSLGAHTGVQQSSTNSSRDALNFNLPEERILISIDARATSLMTLSRMRRIYTRFDCRQVSRVLGISFHENSTPILLLHNTGVHLNGPSRGIGAVTIGYNQVRCFVPSPTQHTLVSLGGCYILLGLIAQAQTTDSFSVALRTLNTALKFNCQLQAQMENLNGYQILSVFFWKKKHILNSDILRLTLSLITDIAKIPIATNDEIVVRRIQQDAALRDLILECFDLWLAADMIDLVLEFIYDMISSTDMDDQINANLATSIPNNAVRLRNLKCLRDMDSLPRMLRLLPQYSSHQVESGILETGLKSLLENENMEIQTKSFDTKAVYLIKQTVFELLNRTPRQSDILYFGQFVASLLPTKTKERPAQAIKLRNILLKSMLQMITRNSQKEINHAMQEELVRILGFDWFMLFINDVYLDKETISIGFLNLMILLSNDNLYSSFKLNSKASTNGGWLKEPTFPTMDGKFNIQLLGISVGVFFGLSAKRKAIKQEVLEASNFFLLSSCLSNLAGLPQIYLMVFQTMMSRLTKLNSQVLDDIESFKELSLDSLCDCLVGDTHHKRRQTLTNIQFRCHELVVCLIYMIRDIMWRKRGQTLGQNCQQDTTEKINAIEQYPVDVARFLMYLYNNNRDFQAYCRSNDELVDALCACLMEPDDHFEHENLSKKSSKPITDHPALKQILELSRLIILDTMSEPKSVISSSEVEEVDNLRIFERFLDSLSSCREAQGELVDELMQQMLLMIDSTARHNSIKTIGSADNVIQFQLLLINSISMAEIVTDKIWSQELYSDNWNRVLKIIDHQLCLAEQIFKFNELLPKRNPPHAFIMQRVLNRILLFALSRPMEHMSDRLVMLELLKKIHDNRTIIILNHMHSPHSAEFFVCFTFCLMNIIEDNMSQSCRTALQSLDQPTSLIERQFGHPSLSNARIDINAGGPSSSSLLLVSMVKKVWDAIYQSKKGILSEALDVSLSLPAFTLDTSLDLMQLKPDIFDSCKRYWLAFVETKQRSRQRKFQQRQAESTPASGTTASSAVNLLSGRLTRVVNAANFVSRVVGATAGSMASNVNMVGEKLSQTSRPHRAKDQINAKSSTESNSNNNQTPTSSSQTSVGNFSSSSTDQNELFKSTSLSKHDLKKATQIHISFIQEYIESQVSQKNQKLALHKYLCDEWLDTEQEVLLRERAIFGPDYGSKLDKWCLDLTEGPKRMRKKMVNNTKQFYEHYTYRPEQYNPDNKSLRYRPPMSYDSHSYYIKNINLDDKLFEFLEPITTEQGSTSTVIEDGSFQSTDVKQISTTVNLEPNLLTVNIPNQDYHSSVESLTPSPKMSDLGFAPYLSSPKPSEVDVEDGDSTSFVDFSPEIEAETNSARESAENTDSLSVLRLLEKNERISHMFRCSRVQGLDTYEGLLLFGREHFYLIDGFTLLKTREIKDIDSLPPDAHDPIIPNSTPNILAHSKKTCAKFSFDSIVEVHKRRYLLQPIALEVFSSDGRNTLIVFPRNIRNKVYSRLMTVSTQLTNNAHESLAGQKSNVSVEGGSGLLSNLIGETSVTQRWVRGELSNFQYLMNLNTIAGRSYNDLMQYPIFPWILADYTSDYLDLTKPSTFRDLSRPVGAQTSERTDQFKRRFSDWDDSETPPYHYGTFYSSAMIVASYMVRMEPFTQHFLRLQGGHFDLADRMFHSINDSWLSASKHNMADIKELIPEFFYLPEFLKNDNKYDLGIKQNGMKLDDVILPSWAKNDTREFIRLHRCALESDYVSAHLHEWIDLIFGYKQQGQAAIDAVNVFHHLFYEGNVDIYNTDIDPIKKNAVIGFINNFGQVPKQLFKRPHPARKVTNYSSTPSPIQLGPILPSLTAASAATSIQRVLTRYPQALKQTSTNHKDLRGPVGQIVQMDKSIVAVEQNKLLIPFEYCRYIAWGHADRSLRMGLYDSERSIFVWEGCDHMAPSEILSCTIPNSRIMITAGTDSQLTVWKIEKIRSFTPILSLYGHVEPITCLASSQAYSIIVSGSRDRSVIIWDLNRFTFVRQLGGGPSESLIHRGPISAIAINDSTGDIATCSSSWLYLWTINGELLAHIDSMSSISIQQSMCHGTSSIAANLGSQLHILSVCFSQHNEWDANEVVVTGASDGSVALWSLRYVQSPMTTSELESAKKLKQQLECCLKQEDHELVANEKNLDMQEELQANSGESLEQSNYDEHDERLNPVFCEQDGATRYTQLSNPINIQTGTRRRTSTLNSEWVKLSTSSTSTVDIESKAGLLTPHLSEMNKKSHEDKTCTESVEHSEILNSELSLSLNQLEQDGPNHINECASREEICSTPVSMTAQDQLPDDCSLQDTSRNNYADEPDGPSLSKTNLLLMPSDASSIKFSKSDTSLVDSFVIVDGTSKSNPSQTCLDQASSVRVRPVSSIGSHPTGVKSPCTNKPLSDKHMNKHPYSKNKLLPNHCWRRELYLRALLHKRDSKTLPAAVTSLAISKDHKTLFVGDASGKIVSWSTV